MSPRVVAFARSWREPGKLLLATRLPVLAIMFASLVLLPVDPGKPRESDNLFLDGWARWDFGWYRHIAADGYDGFPNPEGQRDFAFWPLYPVLMRIAAWVFGTKNWALVSLVLNHALLAGATWFLFGLAARRHGVAVARLATLLFLLYPYGVYYSAGYSESTYLFFTLGAFYFADEQRWAPASVLAGIGTAARGVGVTTALALAVLYLEKRDFAVRKVRRDVLWLTLACTGFVAYSLYLWRGFGEPFAYLQSYTSRGWGADVSADRLVDALRGALSWERVHKGQIHVPDLMCLTAFAGVTVLTVLGARRLPIGETVFAVSSLFVYAKMWPTSGRYVGTIFPVYLTLARLLRGRPGASTFVVTTFAVLLSLFTVVFGHWLWLSG